MEGRHSHCTIQKNFFVENCRSRALLQEARGERIAKVEGFVDLPRQKPFEAVDPTKPAGRDR